jgi:ABC-2 type transport system permease protein
MRRIELQAIYIMWLRHMKRFSRSRSRVLATIVQPLFFLTIFGVGFRTAMIPGMTGDYLYFLAPGLITMAIMLSSMYTGISVLWDRQLGFFQEVLVAPISRISIIIGRTLGGATTALIQGFIILVIAIGLGVPISNIFGLMLALIFMILIAFTAVGSGLIIASKLEDHEGFQIVMNLLIMPLFFLSTAFFPIATNPVIPSWVKSISYFNPIFYMVDGLRGSLTGINNAFHPLVDLSIVVVICCIMIVIGGYFFNKSEA